jgi:hypothetical protein
MAAQLHDEQLKSKSLQAQVHQLENLLDSKKQLSDVKEQMLQRIQFEYQQIMTDYTRILELSGVQTGQLRQAKVEISELEAQVETLRGLARKRLAEPPLPLRTAPMPAPAPFLEDFPLIDSDQFPQDIHRQPEISEPEIEIPRMSAPRQSEPPPAPKPRSPMKRAALVDNIKFGDESSGILVDDVNSMSVDEMKALLSVLRAQKEEVERRLNKAPEKGRLQAHIRREHEEREHELDVLNRRIAKIRFSLRKAHEL